MARFLNEEKRMDVLMFFSFLPTRWCPPSYKLVYNPMKTVDISPTKTVVIGVINQLSYRTGTPPCRPHKKKKNVDEPSRPPRIGAKYDLGRSNCLANHPFPPHWMRESQILRRLAFLLNQILQAELFGEFSSWLMSLLKPCFRCPCCTCVRIICPHFTQTFARFGTDPTDEDSQNGLIEEDFRSPLKLLAHSSTNGDLWCVEHSDSDTLDTDSRAWIRRRWVVPHRDGRRL